MARRRQKRLVGYGSPPVENQFKPGKSGNPKGRPKGSKSIDAVLKAWLDKPVTLSVDGRPVRTNALDAMIGAQVTKALKADIKACEFLLQLSGSRGLLGMPPSEQPFSLDGAREKLRRKLELIRERQGEDQDDV